MHVFVFVWLRYNLARFVGGFAIIWLILIGFSVIWVVLILFGWLWGAKN